MNRLFQSFSTPFSRYVVDHHPELFDKNLIEAQPPIKAFMPRAIMYKRKANEELLKVLIEGTNVVDAAACFR